MGNVNIFEEFKAQLQTAIDRSKSSGKDSEDMDVIQKVRPQLQQAKEEVISSPHATYHQHKLAEASMNEKEAVDKNIVDRSQLEEAIEKKHDDKKSPVLQKNQDDDS